MITSRITTVWRWWYRTDWAIGLTIFLVALIPRVLPSGMFMDPDSSSFWIERTRGFVTALGGGAPELFAPALHPGVTLMWLTGLGFGLWRFIEPLVSTDPVTTFAWVIKLPIALATSGLALVSWVYLRSFLPRATAVAIAFIFTVDPLYLVFSRYLHLDGLLAGLVMAGLIATWAGTVRRRWPDVIIGGGLLALAMLTRLNGAVAVAAGLIIILLIGQGGAWRWRVQTLLIFLSAMVVTVLLVWPAVWLAPGAIKELVDTRLGLALLPHEVSPNVDTIPWVRALLYPIFLLTREWLIILVLGVVGTIISWRRSSANHVGRAMTLFIIGWYAVLLAQPKDLDRYVVPVVGPLAVVSGLGFVWLWSKLKRSWLRYGLVFIILLQLVIFYRLGPMFQVYQNGTVAILNRTPLRSSQALTPAWGEGMREAAEYLRTPDGRIPTVAAWYAGVICFYGNVPDGRHYPLVASGRVECPPGLRLLATPAEAEYLILSRDQIAQRFYPALLDDIARLGWRPEKTIAFHGVTIVMIYRNLGGLAETYSLTGQ